MVGALAILESLSVYNSAGLPYICSMKKQPLSQTNSYLRDPEKRKLALVRSVLSSSAVEGIKLTAQDLAALQNLSPNPANSRPGSAR